MCIRDSLVSDGYAEEGFLDTPQGSLQVFHPLFVAYSGPRYDFSERLQRLLMCAVRLAFFPLIGSCHEEELHEDVREDNGSPAGADELLSMFSYPRAVSYTHLRAHETVLDLVCRLLLEKKKKKK